MYNQVTWRDRHSTGSRKLLLSISPIRLEFIASCVEVPHGERSTYLPRITVAEERFLVWWELILSASEPTLTP